jgi:hypothetical protein
MPAIAAPPTTTAVSTPGLLGGTSVNFGFDGYYAYNFNAPIGRANLLRAYNVSSNSFSLNQANVLLENAPGPDHGKRFDFRLDLQVGQAKRNSVNEPRPDIYRDIFQTYGSYAAPIDNRLTIDFANGPD